MLITQPAHDRAEHRDVLPRRLPLAHVLGLALLAGVTAASPLPAAAQTRGALIGQVGTSPAAPGGAMVGLAAEAEQGVLSARAGGGVDAAGTIFAGLLAPSRPSTGAWAVDLDAGLNLGRVPYVEHLFGRLDPTVFGGAGLAGVSTGEVDGVESGTSMVPTWTWGVRTAYPLASWLGVEAEVRRRETIGEVSPERYPVAEGWEYDAGLAIRFGGRTAARPAPARVPRPRGSTGRRTGSRVEPASTPTVVLADASRSESAEEIADRTIRTAGQYVGTRYRWGGDTPAEGFDCSGFVQYVYRQQGIELPRVSRDQARAGSALPTSLDGIAPGDLLFFARDGSRVDHVAIYAGDGRIVHSSSSGSGVRYDDLGGDRGRWYVQHLVAVRRVIEVTGETGIDGVDLAGSRRLPLDEAFEVLLDERGDDAPPPSGS